DGRSMQCENETAQIAAAAFYVERQWEEKRGWMIEDRRWQRRPFAILHLRSSILVLENHSPSAASIPKSFTFLFSVFRLIPRKSAALVLTLLHLANAFSIRARSI